MRLPPGSVDFPARSADVLRQLSDRPRLSLRVRIALAFVIYAAFIAALTVASLALLSRFRTKLSFLEAADECALELQEARRYEKNFFLYGTPLYDALDHANRADRLLRANLTSVREVLGVAAANSWLEDLQRYQAALEELAGAQPLDAARRQQTEAELRRFGGAMLDRASATIAQERLAMNAMVRNASIGIATFLGFMLLLTIILADQVARQVLRPIDRMISYMERIAGGDYTPIHPVRRYRDEFSTLAIAVNRMLDELVARQEQLVQSRKMVAVGTLTSGIAHELNNPLNNISLTVDTLVDDYAELSDDRKRNLLSDISVQVERASATVRNLLDFTRRDQPVFATVPVADVVNSALKLVGNELTLAQVTTAVSIAPDLPPISASPRNLRQVFLNLFVNAIQAMPNGGELYIDADRDGAYLRVSVRDTGVGIPEEDIEKIFEPFFTTKEAGEGTGLGLSVSYHIVEQHGGRIEVKSRPGGGATFSVFLPLPDWRKGSA